MQVYRTPDERFTDLPGYGFEPHYFDWSDAADQPREERVAEQHGRRLGDDERDGVAAAGDQAPRGAIGPESKALRSTTQ